MTKQKTHETETIRLKLTKKNLNKLDKMATKQGVSLSFILNRVLEAI